MESNSVGDPTLGEIINLPYLQVVELLRRNVGLVSRADSHGRTLLSHAAEVGREDIADYLVRAASSVNHLDDTGRTPLHWASTYGNLTIIELLLRANAATEIGDNGGLTPLRWAEISRSGNGSEAKALLLRFGAKPD